jgi:large-conductance mechanosensitive channel
LGLIELFSIRVKKKNAKAAKQMHFFKQVFVFLIVAIIVFLIQAKFQVLKKTTCQA